MRTIIKNKYSDIKIKDLSAKELVELKRSLECDISWVEHDLTKLVHKEESDFLLDNLLIYKNLLCEVDEQM